MNMQKNKNSRVNFYDVIKRDTELNSPRIMVTAVFNNEVNIVQFVVTPIIKLEDAFYRIKFPIFISSHDDFNKEIIDEFMFYRHESEGTNNERCNVGKFSVDYDAHSNEISVYDNISKNSIAQFGGSFTTISHGNGEISFCMLAKKVKSDIFENYILIPSSRKNDKLECYVIKIINIINNGKESCSIANNIEYVTTVDTELV